MKGSLAPLSASPESLRRCGIRLHLFALLTLTALCCFPIDSANAGLLTLLLRSGEKTAVKDAEKGAARASASALRRLSLEEITALASGLGAGVVYVEVDGGQLSFTLLDKAASSIKQGATDLDDLLSKIRSAKGGESKVKLVLTRESAEALRPSIDRLLNTGEVYIVDPTIGPMRLISSIAARSAQYFVELKPGLLAEFDQALPADLGQVLMRDAKPERLAVVPMFSDSDVDSIRMLAEAAGERLLDQRELVDATAKASLSRFRGKTLIVVGHIENSKFVARSANGSIVGSLDIEKLEELARASHTTIISAGCHSFREGSEIGFANSVTDREIANSVSGALKAKTLGEQLGAFGRQNPLVISTDSLLQFETTERLELTELNRYSRQVTAGTGIIRIQTAFEKALVDAETVEILKGWYVIGFVCAILMFRKNRASFLRVSPNLPSAVLPGERLRYIALLILRESIFILLSPIVVAVTVFTFFLGGWTYRVRTLEFLWNFLRRPISATFQLVKFSILVALGLCILFLIYSSVLAVLFAPAVFAIIYIYSEIDRHSEGTIASSTAWLGAVGCAVYLIFALRLFLKFHRRFWKYANTTSSAEQATFSH